MALAQTHAIVGKNVAGRSCQSNFVFASDDGGRWQCCKRGCSTAQPSEFIAKLDPFQWCYGACWKLSAACLGKLTLWSRSTNAQDGIGRWRALCMLAGRSARQSTVRAAQLRLYERVYGVSKSMILSEYNCDLYTNPALCIRYKRSTTPLSSLVCGVALWARSAVTRGHLVCAVGVISQVPYEITRHDITRCNISLGSDFTTTSFQTFVDGYLAVSVARMSMCVDCRCITASQ